MYRRTVVVAAIVLLLLSSIIAYGVDPKHGGTFRFGAHALLSNRAPWVSLGATTYSYLGQVYESLLTYSFPNGEVVPLLAKSWELQDPTTYVFHLEEGVVFHNGNPFTADDVKYSLEQMIAPDSKAVLKSNLAVISSIEVIDDHTVVVNLSEPNSPFLAALASPGAQMVDKEWMEAGADPTIEMNGTGPFVFVDYITDVQANYVRNENYWQAGLPYVDELVVIPYRDDTARVNALMGGEVDFISYVPWQDMALLDANPDYVLMEGFNVFNSLRLNHTQPPFDNVLVRQAINYAIDREELIDLAFGGRGVPIYGGLTYPDTYYYNPDLQPYKYNPDLAIALLKAAGYDDPSDLSFTLTTNVQTIHADTAEIIQAQLTRLGINVAVEPVENPVAINLRTSGGFQALQDGQAFYILDPSAYASWFACASGSAKAIGLCDEQLDTLLALGDAAVDPALRRVYYSAYEERFVRLAPWAFEYWRPQAEAMASYVKGYQRYAPGPIGLLSLAHFETVWLDQ